MGRTAADENLLVQHRFLGGTRISKSWLFAPPFHGMQAVTLTIAGIAIPTLIRLAMVAGIDDSTCTIFCPFVLIVSILCGWRYAAVTAIGSAISCNTILMGWPYRFHFTQAELEGLGTFLFYSFLLIGTIWLFRTTAARSLRQAGARANGSGVVFSLDNGQTWASWYGVDAPVRLGPPEEVIPMMEDFIAQAKVAKRLKDRVA
jgi:hypothetical protein